MEHECSICHLHYKDKAYADKCHAWCSKHNSCNLEVTRHSVESEAAKRGK